jgi:hypothetical protein
MALLTTCTSKNLVIDQELETQYTRSLVSSASNAVEGVVLSSSSHLSEFPHYNDDLVKWQNPVKVFYTDHPYWRYDISRSMSYSYVGLTKAAAENAAMQLTRLLNRPVFPIGYFHGDTTTSAIYDKWFAALKSPGESESTYHLYTSVGKPFKRGTAVATRVEGDEWKVEVSIDESWTIPFLSADNDLGDRWEDFEKNPNLVDGPTESEDDVMSFFYGVFNVAPPKYVYTSDDFITM